MPHTVRLRLAVAAALFLLPAGCVDPAPGSDEVMVADSAGVRILVHPAISFEDGADLWTVAPEPYLVIGDQGDDPYLFHRIGGVVRLGDRRWVVADEGSNEIRYFDPAGNHLMSAGGTGEGPGEFGQVTGLGRLGGDTLAVTDRLTVVHFLDEDGAFFGRFTITGPRTSLVGVLGDGSVVTRTTPPMPQRVTEPRISSSVWRRATVVIAPGSGGGAGLELADTIGTWERLRFVPGWRESWERVRFQEPVGVALQRDGLVVADPTDFEIRRYAAEGTLRTVARFDWDPVEVTPDLVRRKGTEYVHAGGEGGRPVPPQLLQQREEIADSWVFAPHLPAFSKLRVDARDHIWLREYVPNEETLGSHFRTPVAPVRWVVLDPEGRWVARVQTPARLAPLVFEDDLIAGLYRDELDVEQVRVHRLERTTR